MSELMDLDMRLGVHGLQFFEVSMVQEELQQSDVAQGLGGLAEAFAQNVGFQGYGGAADAIQIHDVMFEEDHDSSDELFLF